MRLIDADALDNAFTRLRFNADGELVHWGDRKDWCLHGSEVETLIANAPTVDAVHVVRCKDCIYYHPFAEIKGKGECHIVEDAECLTWYEDCDYCSYGERRSENETH